MKTFAKIAIGLAILFIVLIILGLIGTAQAERIGEMNCVIILDHGPVGNLLMWPVELGIALEAGNRC